MMLIDGYVMVSEKDEANYHEMLVHVPGSILPPLSDVLIIGGGDGGTAREVKKYKSLKRCTLVEIDPLVIKAARKFLSSMSVGLDSIDLRIEDGVEFVRASKEQVFDLVIVDSTDPFGPSEGLFSEEFYRNVAKILKPGGVVVAQGESVFYAPQEQKAMLEKLRRVFAYTYIYNYSNCTYPGGLWSFVMATNEPQEITRFIPKVNLDSLDYYNPQMHCAAFVLPQFMRKSLGHLIAN
jgi:spermidine synthase